MTTGDELNKADDAILEAFHQDQPDYIPLIANRLGMHLPHVETRCDQLIDAGLLTKVTGEAVYCLTTEGEQYLTGDIERDYVSK
jgi:predicted transcriptional regulator